MTDLDRYQLGGRRPCANLWQGRIRWCLVSRQPLTVEQSAKLDRILHDLAGRRWFWLWWRLRTWLRIWWFVAVETVRGRMRLALWREP